MATVHRRHVFYLGGFDPSGPAHYHRLYAEQAALQANVTGTSVEVGPRRKAGPHAAQWLVRCPAAADGTETRYEFMRWDDIVRAHWPQRRWRLVMDTVRTSLLFVRTGACWQILRLSWPAFLALFSPAALLVGLALGLPLLAVLSAREALSAAGPLSALAAAGLLVSAGLALARRVEARLHMQWLMRSFAFTARQAVAGIPALEHRLDEFAARVAERAAQADADEILVVGHSSGTMMAISVLARALRRDASLPGHGPQLSLLTLGQCTPMLSSLPQADAFRADLATLAGTVDVDWVDVSAPPDGCCVALTDPLRAAGLAAVRSDHPKLISPRFASMFDALRYTEIRKDRFRLHFQYLMATDLPAAYDYFAITAGPLTLAERFANQPSVTDFNQFHLFGPPWRP